MRRENPGNRLSVLADDSFAKISIPDRFKDRVTVTRKEFADSLGISTKRVRELEEEGRISSKRIGHRTVLIPVEEFKKL